MHRGVGIYITLACVYRYLIWLFLAWQHACLLFFHYFLAAFCFHNFPMKKLLFCAPFFLLFSSFKTPYCRLISSLSWSLALYIVFWCSIISWEYWGCYLNQRCGPLVWAEQLWCGILGNELDHFIHASWECHWRGRYPQEPPFLKWWHLWASCCKCR